MTGVCQLVDALVSERADRVGVYARYMRRTAALDKLCALPRDTWGRGRYELSDAECMLLWAADQLFTGKGNGPRGSAPAIAEQVSQLLCVLDAAPGDWLVVTATCTRVVADAELGCVLAEPGAKRLLRLQLPWSLAALHG